MFGTLGFSELILILAIILIIFGAGRLPQVGEGVGKALRSFKKEVHDIPPDSTQVSQEAESSVVQAQPTAAVTTQAPAIGPATSAKPNISYVPGPEMTPGTTASLLYSVGPQSAQSAAIPNPGAQATATVSTQPVVSMEEREAAPAPIARSQYPPLPPGVQQKPLAKRPSAIVNKDAVARVQAQQAAMKAKAELAGPGRPIEDMQSLGEGMGDMLRTFRQAVADVRNSVDPQMRTIQAEMDAAQKEIQQSLETATEQPPLQEGPQKSE